MARLPSETKLILRKTWNIIKTSHSQIVYRRSGCLMMRRTKLNLCTTPSYRFNKAKENLLQESRIGEEKKVGRTKNCKGPCYKCRLDKVIISQGMVEFAETSPIRCLLGHLRLVLRNVRNEITVMDI